ncbi:hypothetical protein ACIRL2_08145 [Embleya sp. NPDC127516]|uniref:hypothetical protein n=1 Tax=Embleya sp. NPDC127516 TaxID=3363990 RepID=UPI00381C9EE1
MDDKDTGAPGAPDRCPAGEELRELLGKLTGRRITGRDREALRELAGRLRAAGEVADVLAAVEVKRRGTLPDRDVDLDLLDAALDAGVPVADPPADVALRLAPWLDLRKRRGGLAAVCADPRFRPLLRDAVLDRRADLLALGCPVFALLRTRPEAVDAALASPGLLDVLLEALHTWVAAVRAGSLPALHEAVYYLDLLGPARLVDAHPAAGPPVGELLGTDPAALLARTWRAGLVDELGHRALDRFTGFDSGDDVHPVDLVDGENADARAGFAVIGGMRALVFDARRRVAGPLRVRLPKTGGSSVVATHRHRFEAGLLTAVRIGPKEPRPADCSTFVPVGGERVRALRRTVAGWWELADADGVITARWYQGPSRPHGSSGSHSVGRRRHRWAAGSELVPPAHLWADLVPRDKAGSRVLRAADRALADRILAAVDRELGARLTEIGRRIEVGSPSREVADAYRALREVLDPLLPGIRADRLLEGIAGTVWTAVECRELAARHLDRPAAGDAASTAVVLRTEPRPHPRADAGDLRARYYTSMQDMFERVVRVATVCADPTVDVPPQTVHLVDALGWERTLGRLGNRALRLALIPGSGSLEHQRELARDHLRIWAVPELGDPGGRWRVLEVEVDSGYPPEQDTVCRTVRGCAIVLQRSRAPRGKIVSVLEYEPDGRFGAAPFGAIVTERVCAGWGGMARIAALLRLHHDRGTARWPHRSVAAFAAATGMSSARAAVLTAGFDPYDTYLVRRGQGVDAGLAEWSGTDPGEIADAARELSREVEPEQRLTIPELLMPDDPEDVWADRLAVDRAAAWWHATTGTPAARPGDPGTSVFSNTRP